MNKLLPKPAIEEPVQFAAEVGGVPLNIEGNDLVMSAFATKDNGVFTECLAVHMGMEHGGLHNTLVPVRIQSACLTSEVFGSDRCDCRWQLQHALRLIRDGCIGVLVYMPAQEGRGSGLVAKLKKFQECDAAQQHVAFLDQQPFPSDVRSYRVAMQVLRHLGLRNIALITNNPEKIASAKANGLFVRKRIPSIMSPAPPHIQRYLELKRVRLGHILQEL